MTRPDSFPLWTRIPPPLVFAAVFLGAMFLQRAVWPGAAASSSVLDMVGGVIAGLGLGLGVFAAGLFVAGHTTIIPHGQPSHFIVRGPFARTRNPMYVGMSLVYLGLALWFRAWLALPLLALPIVYVSRWVIPVEEAALRAKFGQEYEDYCRRVRRWL